MTESEIQRDILSYLKTCPHVHVWRSNAGRVQKNVVLAPKGAPDIIGYVDHHKYLGTFIGFEVKQPGKKQSEDQFDWECDMQAAGALYYVVHSVEEVRNIIERIFG